MGKKIVRYKLIKHKWADEIAATKLRRKKGIGVFILCMVCFAGGFLLNNIAGANTAGMSIYEQKMAKIYALMKHDFYFGKNQKDFDQKLITGAIEGLVAAGGDQHTMYLNPQRSQNFTTSMEGSFVGIGVQYYMINNDFMVDKVLRDSPAQEAGIMSGDRIFAINGKETKSMTINEVKEAIVGNVGTKVEIDLLRENKHIKKQIERRKILNSVFSEIKGDTAVLQLHTFAETSGKEVENHLKDISEKGVKKIVIDVRDNGGGYLQAAREIASLLLPKHTVIFKEEKRNGSVEEYKTIDGYTQYTFDKMNVVVNADTASAAEVLAAVLKEQLNAKVIGVKTYGKGTVQVPLTFKDGSMFKYTIAQWMTSKGNKIDGVGITPDIEVNLDPAFTMSAPKLEAKDVYKGDTVNPAAKSVQTYLKLLGYPVDRVDEYFSVASSNALKNYQRDRGLKVTGAIDSEVVTSLLSSCGLKWNEAPERYDLQLQKAVELANGK